MASRTSTALPIASPSGWSICDSTARTGRPSARPSAISVRASARVWSSDGRNAPLPTFTSITSPSAPSATFFDRIDDAMSGIDSTVAVASRSA